MWEERRGTSERQVVHIDGAVINELSYGGLDQEEARGYLFCWYWSSISCP
jgi:hypothetical protein